MRNSNNKTTVQKQTLPINNDMFGLGIQVLKLESRKEIPTNSKSMGKPKYEVKTIDNPFKGTNHIPFVSKAKKTSSVLPNINKAPSQKQIRLEQVANKTEAGKRSADKDVYSSHKIDAIVEYPAGHQPRNINIRHKVAVSAKGAHKTPQNAPEPQPSPLPSTYLIKEEWRGSLNVLPKFYAYAREWKDNERSKAARRKNQEVLATQPTYIEAYVDNQQYFYGLEQQYDPYSIENFTMGAEACEFQDKKYDKVVIN